MIGFEPVTNSQINLSVGKVVLQHMLPVFNGCILEDWIPIIEIKPGEENQKDDLVIFTDPVNPFRRCLIRYIQNKPTSTPLINFRFEGLEKAEIVNSFGLHFCSVKGSYAFLKNGYTSWDGSHYFKIDESNENQKGEPFQVTGFAMIQFLSKNKSGHVVFGFDRHDRFLQVFHVRRHSNATSLTIEVLWDEKPIHDSQVISENLMLIRSQGVEEGLIQWADIIAQNSPDKPRIPQRPITGWCSWYNLYAAITEENILENLFAAVQAREKFDLNLKVFLIDDGFTPEMGDWLEVKPQFPHGMKPVLEKIRKNGFIPGLWIAPFMVGNRSHLYKSQSDWVLKDKSGNPFVELNFYGEFRWHKRSEEYYILDITHPDAFEYMRDVFQTWRNEWGCAYFKTDFMYFGSQHGADEIVYHQGGMTRIEFWRKMGSLIRESIGDALWLGCGCPLWASIGLVDAVRIGRDMGVSWRGEKSMVDLFADQALRAFGNHRLWQIDPDCLLLRDKFHHFTGDEIKSMAFFAGLAGGLVMTSDDLGEIPADRLRWFSFLTNQSQHECRYPLLGRPKDKSIVLDPVWVQVIHSLDTNNDEQYVFVLNSGDGYETRTYSLLDLGLPEKAYLTNWFETINTDQPCTDFTVSLKAHEGILFLVSI